MPESGNLPDALSALTACLILGGLLALCIQGGAVVGINMIFAGILCAYMARRTG